ncbi:MAG: hypothetical protein IJY57_01685 [Clostridia bacterium]|nr:hypothetical protein [Clostridia bacterium]
MKIEKEKISLIRIAFIFVLILTVILGVLSLTTRVGVKKGERYYSKNEVALYLFNYKELPPNFKTKDELYQLYPGSQTNAVKIAVRNGYNFGGDYFNAKDKTKSKDWLGNYTKNINQNFYECDLYPDRAETIKTGSRYIVRLVYNEDCTEIYYTNTHYGDEGLPGFYKVTRFSVNALSNVFVIIYSLFVIAETTLLIILFGSKNEKYNSLRIDVKYAINKFMFFAFILIHFIVYIVKKTKKNSNEEYEVIEIIE